MELAMVHHLLDEMIYRNSRYELHQLLEEVCPAGQGKFISISAFEELANTYEALIDRHLPVLPLSEERLAIFLRIYSDQGVVSQALIQAVESGMRVLVFLFLKGASPLEGYQDINLKRRRFYEADIFSIE
jgi:hypothetical protein